MSNKNRVASMREHILAVARELAQHKAIDQLGLSEIARAAKVSWPTVKRHVGSKEQLREQLLTEQPELAGKLRDTRSRLLAAAARVFARDGYDRATLDDISGEAGMTKGAVYWHFDSKADLFAALVDDYAERVAASDLDEAARADTADDHARFARVLQSQLDRVRAEPSSSWLLLEFTRQARVPELRRRIASALSASRRGLVELARGLSARGVISDVLAPEELGLVVSALLHGLILNWQVAPDEVKLAELGPKLARVLLGGLARPA